VRRQPVLRRGRLGQFADGRIGGGHGRKARLPKIGLLGTLVFEPNTAELTLPAFATMPLDCGKTSAQAVAACARQA
jgi:hypothetical protein